MNPLLSSSYSSSSFPIQKIFKNSDKLIYFLRRKLKGKLKDANLLEPNDSLSYRALLQDTIIVPEDKTNIWIKHPQNDNANEKYPIRDILLRFIEQVLKTNQNYRKKNLLALGYSFKAMNSTEMGIRNNNEIACNYVNTIHYFVKNKDWQLQLRGSIFWKKE